ncbi:MAG: 2-C-methyl-D-erythritol 4-phosphate cytidylyltransferase [Bacteroidia bacterium]|nr:2-C-methyl-D-erythritol 4-phosphate cytidylyltransferase [Bacteroidia bacterium]
MAKRPLAVIVAGGSGKRMGASQPKQFLPLEGKPILIHTLERFLNWNAELEIALVLPSDHSETFLQMGNQYLEKDLLSRVHLCKGGKSRTESVWSGLSFLFGHVSQVEDCLVAIHDGVRPFVSEKVLEHAFQLAEDEGAAVVCVPVKASLRQKGKDGNSVAVDRSEFVEVQTPQVFHLVRIYKAFTQRPHDNFTDDASLYQNQGHKVVIAEGSYDNIKITTPEDLSVGKEILLRQQQ